VRPILVAVDGSEPSMKGLEVAAELSRSTGAPLLMTCVIPPVVLPMPLAADIAERVQDGERAHADLVIRRCLREAAGRGLKADGAVLRGEPAEAISDAAESRDCSMVVVGSRGRGGVARVLLGSTADRLVHLCKRPVLVVK
jgi:nucleotide-binding universal stress UspA family protein